jgi:predicted phosphodiesterase
VRLAWKLDEIFIIEKVKVWITHIGGYPKKYNLRIEEMLEDVKPNLFICGHSHILKVQYDTQHKMLHMNPGAAGLQGFHQVRTMLRFEIEGEDIKNLEIIEMKKSL